MAADAVALPHLVQHGCNGFRFPPGDVTTAAAHLRAVLTDERLRMRMGAASRDLIAGHSLHVSLERFEELYVAAAEHRRAAATAAAAA